MKRKAKPPPHLQRLKPSRAVKLNRIGQAHLAPGMTLLRWQQILAAHHIGQTWHNIPDQTLDSIIQDIIAIVEEVKATKQ